MSSNIDQKLRPFTILGVQQIAIGSLDRSDLHRLWVDLLGLRQLGAYTSSTENVDEEVLSLGSGAGRVEIDLMQPLDPSRKPKIHEPPLHHIGLWVSDLKAAVMWLQAQGVRFTEGGIRRGASGHEVCFIHPKPKEGYPLCGEGVLIELVQAPASLIEDYQRNAEEARHAHS